MSTTNMSMNGMMVPWLHFTGGDNLLFKAWSPSSHGAIAGACIGLVFLAVLERLVSGLRGVLEAHWKKRALALMSSSSPSSPSPSDACHIPSSPPSLKGQPPDEVEEVNTGVLTSQGSVRSQRLPRTVPPFIASHDVPRGALFALQSLLFYILMLAVMTFQAAFLISIIVGLAVGEVLSGRLGGGKGHIGH